MENVGKKLGRNNDNKCGMDWWEDCLIAGKVLFDQVTGEYWGILG